MLFVVAALWPDVRGWLATRHEAPSWTRGDLDTAYIHAGLVAAPRFADTLRWWTGPWVMGQGVPFYELRDREAERARAEAAEREAAQRAAGR